jgi:hypothetical protein
MKNDIYKVQILNDDKSIKAEKSYKKLTNISTDLNIDYHTIREIYRMTENRTVKKFTKTKTQELFNKIHIYDIEHEINI